MLSQKYVIEESFPKIKPHTSIAFLRRCEGYQAAKNGDIDAARRVANACVKSINLPCTADNVVALPVLSSNMIPLAVAELTHLPICTTVRKVACSRQRMSGIERLVSAPVFIGYVEEGTEYILIDDVITQGGTLAALRRFVLERGGRVSSAIVLAQSKNSGTLAPTNANLTALDKRFGESNLTSLLEKNSIAHEPCELTNAQLQYMLKFKSISHLELKLSAQSCRKNPIKNKK